MPAGYSQENLVSDRKKKECTINFAKQEMESDSEVQVEYPEEEESLPFNESFEPVGVRSRFGN